MSSVTAYTPLTSEAIRGALSTTRLGRTLYLIEELPSTNAEACRLAHAGAPDGTVVVAETQTAGRGRLGRHWYSPPGKNLYCSTILRGALAPDLCSLWLSWVPLLSALAIARVVEATTGLAATVKWPNDVLLAGRKVAGILCESGHAGTASPFAVVGIGLNVNTLRTQFPEHLQTVATSMAAEAGRPFDRAGLLARLLCELEIRHETLLSEHRQDVYLEYRLRCSTIGRDVRVELADGRLVEGFVEAINDDGSLHVTACTLPGASTGARSVLDIRAGDIVHLRKAGSSTAGT